MKLWLIYDPTTGALKYFCYAPAWSNAAETVLEVDPSDAAVQDAQQHLSHYTVQNGTLVKTVTDAQLLAEAQAAQIAQLRAGYAQTVAGGFVATVGGAQVTFGWQEADQRHLLQVQSAIDKAIDTFPVPYADINGASVSIPDQTTLTAIETAADKFDWAQIKQLRTMIAQVQAATTVAAVEAITWTPGN